MLATLLSMGLQGLDGYPIEAEVDVRKGMPSFVVVGLPDEAVRESRDRVRAALHNSGYDVPPRRITVNLAPADTKKEGPSFDLPIALGILACTDAVPCARLKDFVFLGELALDGSLRPTRGVLPIAMELSRNAHTRLVLPEANAKEAAVVPGIRAYGMRHLRDVVSFLNGQLAREPSPNPEPGTKETSQNSQDMDFADVHGQAMAKRALEVAVAGGHNVLMIGPPGAGKTMLAGRIPSIAPPMTWEEAIAVTKVHSLAGIGAFSEGIVAQRPFRAPHHTISDAGLIGGGVIPRPGEVSMAHNGVLFLDELPEFRRNVLEALRQPLEEGSLSVVRARKATRFPAQFMLVASMNPCQCGFLGDPKRQCRCTPNQIKRYLGKVSGPLLDRIDMHLEIGPVAAEDMARPAQAEPSAVIRERVVKAREVQAARLGSESAQINGQLRGKALRRHCRLSEECRSLITGAMDTLGMSARAHDRVLRVARTIADLGGREEISVEHVSEALQYRGLDRSFWERI